MNIVFMGTPDFSVGALEAIIQAGHHVSCVVTQPDKRKGRGKEMQYPPVKECAMKYNIPVFQPVKIKTSEAVEELKKYPADLFVVVAFGQILSQEILDMPKFGCVNIHASLLPKYRGAAPIQWVILDGEEETGVTIMQMDAGLDTGDMLLKGRIAIAENDTGESLHDKLAELGAELIVEALPMIENGTLQPEKQDDTQTCYAKMLAKSLGKIDWMVDGVSIERKIRGLNSWPSAYTYYKGKTLKIWHASLLFEELEGSTGMIVKVEKEAIYVKTGNGILRIDELQLEGKRKMTVKDFLLGYPVKVGEILGN